MRTDTPQTDAVLSAIFDRDGYLGKENAPEDLVVLCRKLEEENQSLRLLCADRDYHYAASGNVDFPNNKDVPTRDERTANPSE